jgi:glycosyltransferase involved in cell wall biosynthesis
MRAPTVAIVLFNYNGGPSLRECLDGVCGQTRPADQVIVIDDGSTDDSAAVVEAVAARHGHITLMQNGRNLGLQQSIAGVLPLVAAEYLVWITPDDRLLPAFLEKSMPPLERHPDAGLCFSASLDPRDPAEHMPPAAIRQRMKRAYLPIGGNAVVVRRTALLAVGGYPAELDRQSESFAHVVVALRFGACVVPEPLALRRVDPDPGRHAAASAAMLDLLAQPRYRDIRRAFRQCPSNFSLFRLPGQSVPFHRARDWDLLLASLRWSVRAERRARGLTPAGMLARLGVRLLRLVRSWCRRLLAALGRSVRDALRSVRSAHHTLRLMAVALLEDRVRHDARATSFVATVRGPVTQDVARNVVAWQVAMPSDPPVPGRRGIHGRLCVAGDRDDVQLDRLFSLLCASGVFEDLTISFSEPDQTGFDLGATHDARLGTAELARVQRAFLPSFDGRRTVTSFLKIVHPRAVIVALSLSEDDDGFADEALAKWLPHLHRFRREVPGVAFCLLNRTMPSQDREESGPAASPVRSLGFGLSDAIALAQAADAFVGRLDVFGLAALAARRPGVYVAPPGDASAVVERSARFVTDAAPEQSLELLRTVLREERATRPRGAACGYR